MSNIGSEMEGEESHKQSRLIMSADKAEVWLQKNLRGIWIVLFALSLGCFLLWLGATIWWPSLDMSRGRAQIALAGGPNLIIDYPKRFLADDKVRPVYLTADASVPFAITLELPSSLPLILVSAEPSSAITIADASSGLLSVAWPLPSSTPTAAGSHHTVTPAATTHPTAIIPVLSQPQTVSLFFRNANSERCCQSKGFTAGLLKVVEAGENGAIPIDIETVDRASWRSFAEKYSPLVVLPFLATVFLSLGKAYSDRQKSQRQETIEKLEAFKQAMSAAEDPDAIKNKWQDLEQHAKHLTLDDWKLAKQSYDFSLGIVSGLDETTSFNTWSDSWAGALMLAHNSGKLDQEISYRLIRIFPKDKLSPFVENRFRVFEIKVGLSPLELDWPMRMKSPEDYPSEAPKSIVDLRLFPTIDAAYPVDQSYLFSEKQWYWDLHPVHTRLTVSNVPMLVCGQSGCGRTALALSVTRHAKSVLGYYHQGSLTFVEAQQGLAQELLNFVLRRSTRLTRLRSEDREVLATLLRDVFNVSYLQQRLCSPDDTQIDRPEIGEERRETWKMQSQVELNLLRQSIEQTRQDHPLSAVQWFQALSSCAKRMGFLQVRVALDMTIQQYNEWCGAYFWQFLLALRPNPDPPAQLVVLAPGGAKDFDTRCPGFSLQELEWHESASDEESPLVLMLRYRLIQRIKDVDKDAITRFVPAGVQRALCKAAHHNPRHLALLWQHISGKYPDARRVTIDMVSDAETVFP